MVSNEERLRRRWWMYSKFDNILNEVAFYRKFTNEVKLPGQTVWTWGVEEVRTELDVDTG